MAYVDEDHVITGDEAFKIDGYIETVARIREEILKPMAAKDIAEMLEVIVGNEPDKLNDLYEAIGKLPSFRKWFVAHRTAMWIAES